MSGSTTGFGVRLAAAREARGALCVGIDPHAALLREWGLEASGSGVREFGLRVVEAVAGRIAVVKPQVAFFERYGAEGLAALQEVMRAAREAGLLVIADAKRGDIGSTMRAYAETWLLPGAPLEADALTVSPYLGVGAAGETAELAAAHGKGLFVLAATSNPEGAGIQGSRSAEGVSVARSVLEEVSALSARTGDPVGPFGVVLGATVDLAGYGIDVAAPRRPAIPVLAPGFGHQGGRLEDARGLFGALVDVLLVSESRSILSAGPSDLAAVVETRAGEVRAALA